MKHSFRVWAPGAATVDADPARRRLWMARGDGGGWHRVATGAGPGPRNEFTGDGRSPRPAPRSLSQPDGSRRLSAVVDRAEFDWTDARWRGPALAGAELDELQLGTFTLEAPVAAVTGRLAHLVDLGVDAIVILFVAEFAGTPNWGCDGVNVFAPHHADGGPRGLKQLVDRRHAMGIGGVMDVVSNHLGPVGNYLSGSLPTSPRRPARPGAPPSTAMVRRATRSAAW